MDWICTASLRNDMRDPFQGDSTVFRVDVADDIL